MLFRLAKSYVSHPECLKWLAGFMTNESPLQPLSFNIVISKPHTLITWTIQDVLFDLIFLYFIEKIIKSFLAILKAIYSQLLDDLPQHLKKSNVKIQMRPETHLFKLKAIIQALWVCLQASNIKLTENNMTYLFANQSAI